MEKVQKTAENGKIDMVPHRRLLYKRDFYGIRGSTHKWVVSWLSGRFQKVALDSQASDPIYLMLLSRSITDHHLRYGGWLNFEFSKRGKHLGWAIKTIYKKQSRGMLKRIPLNPRFK